MEIPTNNEPMLLEKYEALLNGIIPEDYKDHILSDKLILLQKQNTHMENTILSLKNELSSFVSVQNRQSPQTPEKNSKYSSISYALTKCLDVSEVEILQYSEIHSKALEAVNKASHGFSDLMSTLTSNLFPPNKKILEFNNKVLDQVREIKSQIVAVQNYVSMLEFNDKSTRERFSVFERNGSNKSHSVSRMDLFEQPVKAVSKRFTGTLISEVHSTKNSIEYRNEDVQNKINSMKIALGKIKNQRDEIDIENQKLLMQLKQAKEQLALCEENSAAKEVNFENQIRRLKNVIARIKEIPNLYEIINKCEREVAKGRRGNHRRTNSNLPNNNFSFSSFR